MSPAPGAPAIARTQRLQLFEVEKAHLPALHELAMHPEVRRHWRTRGQYIAPRAWEHFLCGVPAWNVVGIDQDHGIIGCAELLDLELLDGHGHLSLFCGRRYWGSSLTIELGIAFAQLCFDRYPIQKLYAVVADGNTMVRDGLIQRFAVEGRLRDYLRIDGQPQDAHIVAIEPGALSAALKRGAVATWLPGSDGGRREDVDLEAVLTDLATMRGVPVRDLLETSINALDSIDLLELLSRVESWRGYQIEVEALVDLTVSDLIDLAGVEGEMTRAP